MTNWIIPCNLKYYDVFGAFENLKILDWKQTNPSIEAGDIVFIYVGAPVKAIVFKCLVKKANMNYRDIDDSLYSINADVFETFPRQMELELIEQFDNEMLSASVLAKQGLKGRVMCPRRMEPSVLNYINTII